MTLSSLPAGLFPPPSISAARLAAPLQTRLSSAKWTRHARDGISLGWEKGLLRNLAAYFTIPVPASSVILMRILKPLRWRRIASIGFGAFSDGVLAIVEITTARRPLNAW